MEEPGGMTTQRLLTPIKAAFPQRSHVQTHTSASVTSLRESNARNEFTALSLHCRVLSVCPLRLVKPLPSRSPLVVAQHFLQAVCLVSL